MKQSLTIRPGRVQLGSGVLVTGIAPESLRTMNSLRTALAAAIASGDGVLGMTGTGSFCCVPKLICPGSGSRTAVAGEVICAGWNIRLQGVLREFTPSSLRLLLNSGGCGARLSLPEEPRHLPLLCWVGDTTNGLTVIVLREALNTAGLQLSLRETGTGSLAFCFEAFTEDPDEDAPCLLLFPEEEQTE